MPPDINLLNKFNIINQSNLNDLPKFYNLDINKYVSIIEIDHIINDFDITLKWLLFKKSK